LKKSAKSIVGCAALLVGLSPPAVAAPLYDSRPGGLALVGPAHDHPASAFYNPATLTLQPGHHLFFDSNIRYGVGSVALAPADPATGAPSTGEPRRDSLRALFPQLYLQLSSDLGSESVVFSLTLHTPFSQRYSFLRGERAGELFDPEAQGAARYHAVELTSYHLFVTPAASFKIIDELSFGVAVSYVFGELDLAFARDAALDGGRTRTAGEYAALDDCGGGARCDYGSGTAAEAVRVRGKANGIAIAAGVLGRPHPRVAIGLAYVSRVVGIGGENIPAKGDAWVRRSRASLDNARSDPELASSALARDLSGRGTVSYSLPDMVHVGVSWRVRPRLLLALQASWLNFSNHDQLDIRLTGTQFRAKPQIPDRLVQFRGFQDVVAVQLGAGWELTPALGLEVASMFESSAVPNEALSPAAVDGAKVDSLLALRWRPHRRITLRAGYGLVLMPAVQVASSAFAPSEMVSCVDGHYDVDLPECRRALAGRGMASAAGRYQLTTHRFGLSFSYDVW
jgi:long-subunit fatty acid transport protein